MWAFVMFKMAVVGMLKGWNDMQKYKTMWPLICVSML